MLKKFKLHKKINEQGEAFFIAGPEQEEIPCRLCGEEAFPVACPRDNKIHHHGHIHLPSGKLIAVCNKCLDKVIKFWQKKTKSN